MGSMFLCNTATYNLFRETVRNHNGQNFPPLLRNSEYSPPNFTSSSQLSKKIPFKVNCSGRDGSGEAKLSTSSAYTLLGVNPDCSASELKAAFRAKILLKEQSLDRDISKILVKLGRDVKEFHPDVKKDKTESDLMIRLVIQAYEMLSNLCRSEIIESYRECLDPFEKPECEASDIFVNQSICIGKGCPYSCVERAPHAFSFSSIGTAQATSQGHSEDYQVQLAVGQCPRSCIHYVTPSQRVILEELLDSILNVPYDTSAEADLLYSLIVKARYENNRYRTPQKKPTSASTKHVDWY